MSIISFQPEFRPALPSVIGAKDLPNRLADIGTVSHPQMFGNPLLSHRGFLRQQPGDHRNLCVGALLETVRDRKREVGLDQVNRVLMQPHWRKEHDTTQ